MLDVKRLYYFVKTIDCENVRSAAMELQISQQGLQKQLAKLESDLAFKLYRVSDETVLPTQEGQYIYNKVRPIFEEMDKWETDVIEFKNAQSKANGYPKCNVS